MAVVESFGGEQEGAELGPIHAVTFGRLDSRPADVLGRVGRDPAVDVGEPVQAHTVDSRRSIVEAAKPRSSMLAR